MAAQLKCNSEEERNREKETLLGAEREREFTGSPPTYIRIYIFLTDVFASQMRATSTLGSTRRKLRNEVPENVGEF